MSNSNFSKDSELTFMNFSGNSSFEEKTHQEDSKNDNQLVQVLDNDKLPTSTNQVDSTCISILDNDKEVAHKNKKKYKKKKNKNKQKQQCNSMTSELSTSTTSSKDTSVESDHNNESSLRSKQTQVSRLPGQIKPKRWQKWNWRGHTVPASTTAASKIQHHAS